MCFFSSKAKEAFLICVKGFLKIQTNCEASSSEIPEERSETTGFPYSLHQSINKTQLSIGKSGTGCCTGLAVPG